MTAPSTAASRGERRRQMTARTRRPWTYPPTTTDPPSARLEPPNHAAAYSAPMGRDPFAPEEPSLQDVLDALDDPDCRAVIERLDEPMTVAELAEASGIPKSTLYRKLDLLSEAGLVEERLDVRADGRHTKRFVVDFEEVRVSLGEDNAIELGVERRDRTPEERLSELWSEVRKET